jgi:uncharacterized protein involved in outer membrane biogenesis
MKHWKKILIAAAAFILIIIAAIYGFLSLYDFNKFKPTIATLLQEKIGRVLTIEGDINLKFGPGFILVPTVAVESLRLQNAQWGSRPDLARIKRMEVSLSLLPLISGKLRFSKIILDEPDVMLEIDRSGKTNFDFEPAGKPADKHSDKPSDEIDEKTPLPALIFDDVRISRGLLTIRDQGRGRALPLRIDRLNLDIPGLSQSMKIKFEGVFKDRPVQLQGDVGPIAAWIEPGIPWPLHLEASTGNNTVVVQGEIRDPKNFQDLNFNVGAKGPSLAELAAIAEISDFPDPGGFDLTARVSDQGGILAAEKLDLRVGSLDLAEMVLSGSVKNLPKQRGIELDFKVTGKDAANLTRLGFPPPRTRGPFEVSGTITDPAEKQYNISGIKILADKSTFAGNIDLNLAAEPPRLEARLTSPHYILGPSEMTATLTGPLDRISLKTLDLKIGDPKHVKIWIKGGIKNLTNLEGVDMDFDLQGEEMVGLEKFIHRSLPLQGGFAASGEVLIPEHGKLYIPELKISLGGSTINGSVELNLQGEKPQIDARLFSPKFQLSGILKPALRRKDWVKAASSLQSFKLDARLSGFAEALSLEALDFKAGDKKRIAAVLTGSVHDLSSRRGLDLKFEVQGNNAAELKKYLGQRLPVQGPFSVSGRLTDTEPETYNVNDLKIVLDKNAFGGGLKLDLAGKQPRLTADLSAGKFNLKGLPILRGKAWDGLKRIGNLGPLALTARLDFPKNKIAIDQISLKAGTEDLIRINITGTVNDIMGTRGIDLKLSAKGREISKLKQITGRPLVLQGAYALSGRLRDPVSRNFLLEDLEAVIGNNRIGGKLKYIDAGKRSKLLVDLSGSHLDLNPFISNRTPDGKPAGKKDDKKELTLIPDLGPFQLKFQLTGLSEKPNVKGLNILAGDENLVRIQLSGEIKDLPAQRGFNIDFAIHGNDFANLKKISAPVPSLKGLYRLSGRVSDLGPKIYKIDNLKLRLGDNDVRGAMTLDLKQARPKIKAEVSAEKIDIRPLLAETEKKESNKTRKAKPDPKKDKVFSTTPLTFDALNRIDLDIKIRDKKILLPRFALDVLALDMLLRNGRLALKPFTFKVKEGSFDGRLMLDTKKSAPELALEIHADQLDLDQLLNDLGAGKDFKGKVNADIRLSGSGNSQAAIMAGLNGKIHVHVSEGRASNTYLVFLQRFLGTDILRILNPFEKNTRYSDINCLITYIDIKNGLANGELLLDNDQTTVLGSGDLDLRTEQLDFGIDPTPKKGTGISGVGSVSFSFKELSQPFRLGGTLAAPAMVLDPTTTVLTVGKFAGALALGPAGIAAFFSNVSLGKTDPCSEMMKAIEKIREKPESAEIMNAGGEPTKGGTQKKKSKGFFKRLFGQ